MKPLLHAIWTQIEERNLRPSSEQWIRFGISLLLAILLWGWVTQLQDPFTTRTIANVQVVPDELPGELQLVSALPDVRVTFQGAESRLEPIRPSDITVRVDTSRIDEPGMYTVDLYVEGPDVSRRSVEPETVTIQVDERVTRQFPLRESYAESSDTGRTVTSIDPAVTAVTVIGPKTAVDRVRDVILPITLGEQVSPFDAEFIPEAVDSSGQRVTEVQVLPERIMTRVNVQVRGREVSVIPVISGIPAEGYSVQQRRALPDTIIVDGPDEILDDLLFVNTEPVDVSEATESISTEVGLADLPNGVTVLDPADGNVEVRVAIEDVSSSSQTLTDLPVSTVGLGEGLTATVEPATLTIQVSAPVDILQGMTPADIHTFVDLTGYGPGTYRIPPTVTVPQGATWQSSEPQAVIVTISPDTGVSPAASPSSILNP